jgi:hypothetical protein
LERTLEQKSERRKMVVWGRGCLAASPPLTGKNQRWKWFCQRRLQMLLLIRSQILCYNQLCSC